MGADINSGVLHIFERSNHAWMRNNTWKNWKNRKKSARMCFVSSFPCNSVCALWTNASQKCTIVSDDCNVRFQYFFFLHFDEIEYVRSQFNFSEENKFSMGKMRWCQFQYKVLQSLKYGTKKLTSLRLFQIN